MVPDTTDAVSRDGQNVAQVHDRLRDEILRGNISAGETTSQVALARELGVGRTPLREALRMLQREGLVVSQPNRRVRIADLSAEDAEQLYIMRIALESVAIRLTVPRLGSDGIAELEGYMAQMDHYVKAADWQGFRTPHRAFHARLVNEAGERVAEMIAQLFDHAERYRLAYGGTTPPLWAQRRAEHRGILDAAAAGDANLAAERLVDHYARTAALIFAGLGNGDDPVRLRAAIAAVAPAAQKSLDK
jgi:GntR family transcriptional regulator, rspAB operon transcriptional repressor